MVVTQTQIPPVLRGYSAVVAFITLAGHADAADKAIIASHLAVPPQFAVLDLTARLLDVASRAATIILRVSFIVMVVVIVANGPEVAFLLEVLQLDVDGRESLATYRDFALPLLVSLALCADGQRRIASRALTYMEGLAVLFLTCARSEFLAFFPVAFTPEWSLFRNRCVVSVLAGGGRR